MNREISQNPFGQEQPIPLAYRDDLVLVTFHCDEEGILARGEGYADKAALKAARELDPECASVTIIATRIDEAHGEQIPDGLQAGEIFEAYACELQEVA
jgi:hypothetical protein